MSKKRLTIETTLILLATIYAITIATLMIIRKADRIMEYHPYITALISFFSTCKVMTFVIKEHDTGVRLYTSLGISCLTLGNLYFTLLNIVKVKPDILSVGLFAKICCYLFFISALTGLKQQRNKVFVIVINTISIISTIICAYSVITNNVIVINISVLLLDILCITLACGLLSNKQNRLFPLMMLIIASFDFISFIIILSPYISLLSPLLYILITKSVIQMEVGEQNAK